MMRVVGLFALVLLVVTAIGSQAARFQIDARGPASVSPDLTFTLPPRPPGGPNAAQSFGFAPVMTLDDETIAFVVSATETPLTPPESFAEDASEAVNHSDVPDNKEEPVLPEESQPETGDAFEVPTIEPAVQTLESEMSTTTSTESSADVADAPHNVPDPLEPEPARYLPEEPQALPTSVPEPPSPETPTPGPTMEPPAPPAKPVGVAARTPTPTPEPTPFVPDPTPTIPPVLLPSCPVEAAIWFNYRLIDMAADEIGIWVRVVLPEDLPPGYTIDTVGLVTFTVNPDHGTNHERSAYAWVHSGMGTGYFTLPDQVLREILDGLSGEVVIEVSGEVNGCAFSGADSIWITDSTPSHVPSEDGAGDNDTDN